MDASVSSCPVSPPPSAVSSHGSGQGGARASSVARPGVAHVSAKSAALSSVSVRLASRAKTAANALPSSVPAPALPSVKPGVTPP